MPDYEALARKHGGVPDYEAIAAKYGGSASTSAVSATAPTPTPEQPKEKTWMERIASWLPSSYGETQEKIAATERLAHETVAGEIPKRIANATNGKPAALPPPRPITAQPELPSAPPSGSTFADLEIPQEAVLGRTLSRAVDAYRGSGMQHDLELNAGSPVGDMTPPIGAVIEGMQGVPLSGMDKFDLAMTALDLAPQVAAGARVARNAAGRLRPRARIPAPEPAPLAAPPPIDAVPPKPTPPPIEAATTEQPWRPFYPAARAAETFFDAGPVPKGSKSAAESAATFERSRRYAQRPVVPETGMTERDARIQDARERIAPQVADGKSWDELTESERVTVDQLVEEGHGFSVTPAEMRGQPPLRAPRPIDESPPPAEPIVPQETATVAPVEPPPPTELPAPPPIEPPVVRTEAPPSQVTPPAGSPTEPVNQKLISTIEDMLANPDLPPERRVTLQQRLDELRPPSASPPPIEAPTAAVAAPEPGLLERLDLAGQEASARLRERMGNQLNANAMFDPANIRDTAISIAGDVARAGIVARNSFQEFAVMARQKYGDVVEPHLDKLWQEVQGHISQNSKRTSVGLGLPDDAPLRRSRGITEIHPEVADYAIEEAAKRTGVTIVRKDHGVGAYLDSSEPAVQVKVMGTPEQIADFMDHIGYGLQQTEVIATNRNKAGNAYAVDIVQLVGEELASPEAALQYWKTLRDAGAPPEMVAGFQQIMTKNGRPGVRFLNFEGAWDNSQIAALDAAAAKVAETAGFETGLSHSAIDLVSSKNNWTEAPNGEAYQSRILGRQPGSVPGGRGLDSYGRAISEEIARRHEERATSGTPAAPAAEPAPGELRAPKPIDEGATPSRRETERGSFSTKPAPEKQLPTEEYQRLEKFSGLSPEAQAEFRKLVDEEVATMRQEPRQYPLRPRSVGFEQVGSWADAIDEAALRDVGPLKAGETLAPEVRLAGERAVKRWMEEEQSLLRKIQESGEQLPPEQRTAMEQRLAQLDLDSRRMIDNLVSARTQDGRNLVYHKIDLYQNGVNSTRIFAKLKRAYGGEIPTDVHAAARAAIDAAAQAEAKAATRMGIRKDGRLTPEQRQAINSDPAVKAEHIKIAKLIAKQEQSGWLEMIAALRKAGLLTGVKTHLRNIGGNATFQIMEEAARVPASAADIAMSVFSKKRTVAGASIGSVSRGIQQAATKGVAEAKAILQHGVTPEQAGKLEVSRELNFQGLGKASKVINAYVNGTFRLLSAEDRLAKSYAIRRALEAQAKVIALNEAKQGAIPQTQVIRRWKELADAPTESMAAEAVTAAEFATFNNPNALATLISGGRRLAKQQPGGKYLDALINQIMPFILTPTNLMARMIDYSPAALVKVGVNTGRAIKGRELTAVQQKAIAEAIGRGSVGSALMYLGYKAAEAGWATGAAPEEQAQRDTNEAAGRTPGSVKVGGQWHRISAFAPGGTVFTIGATIQRESTRELKDEAKRIGNMIGAGTKTLSELPMMQGVQEVHEAMESPSSKGERLLASQAGSFIPTIVSDVGALTDPYRRDVKAEGGSLEAMKTGVMARVPGLRNQLPPKMDVFGEPIPENPLNAVNPFLSTKAKETTDPLMDELVQERVGVGKSARQKGEDPEVHRLRLQLTGKMLEENLRALAEDAGYQSLDRLTQGDDLRKKLMDEAAEKARREVGEITSTPDWKDLDPEDQREILQDLIEELVAP